MSLIFVALGLTDSDRFLPLVTGDNRPKADAHYHLSACRLICVLKLHDKRYLWASAEQIVAHQYLRIEGIELPTRQLRLRALKVQQQYTELSLVRNS